MPSTPAAFSASSTPACRFAPSITISGGIAPAAAILASWPSFALKLQRTCATALHRLSKCDVRNETSRGAHELLIDHIIVASNGLQCVQHTHHFTGVSADIISATRRAPLPSARAAALLLLAEGRNRGRGLRTRNATVPRPHHSHERRDAAYRKQSVLQVATRAVVPYAPRDASGAAAHACRRA